MNFTEGKFISEVYFFCECATGSLFVREVWGKVVQITKIVNNNIVISEDKNHKEVVLMGKGLGFQKHKGD